MNRLANVGVGDRVRLYGDRFAMGYVEGTLIDETSGGPIIFRLRMDDPQMPVGLLYDTVGTIKAVVCGVMHHVSSVERLEVAA